MTVSFVIPTWNRSDLLATVLRSIAELRTLDGVRIETIVVDNGSTDNSAAVARGLGARLLPLARNEGFSKAINEGIRHAAGERIALLNNDVTLKSNWLAMLLRALERPNVWFATGKILRAEDSSQIDGAGDAICRGGAAWRLGAGRPDGELFAATRRTFFPSGTAALFRREFFDAVGLFEERFFAYLEDADLGIRAGLADLEGVYAPAAIAYHRGGATVGRWSPAMVRWMTAHQILLLAKFYPASLLWRFALPIGAVQTLWGALAISRGRLAAWLRGVADGLRCWRAFRRSGTLLRDASRLAPILEAAEREIIRIQSQTGWDAFWRWYVRLARPSLREAV